MERDNSLYKDYFTAPPTVDLNVGSTITMEGWLPNRLSWWRPWEKQRYTTHTYIVNRKTTA